MNDSIVLFVAFWAKGLAIPSLLFFPPLPFPFPSPFPPHPSSHPYLAFIFSLLSFSPLFFLPFPPSFLLRFCFVGEGGERGGGEEERRG